MLYILHDNIWHHILSYPIILYHIISYYIIYHIIMLYQLFSYMSIYIYILHNVYELWFSGTERSPANLFAPDVLATDAQSPGS